MLTMLRDFGGVYLLLVEVEGDMVLDVGSLGPLFFTGGLYLYVGSGQAGVMRRIGRYFKDVRNIRWHIDYLLTSGSARPVQAVVFQKPRRYECILSDLLRSSSSYMVAGFGSSDCSCPSHLYRVGEPWKIIAKLSKQLGLDPLFYR